MKTIINLFSLVAISLLLNSCGIHASQIINQNQNATQVQLSGNNFKIIDKVSGTAEINYICLIGGMNRTQLYSKAYADLINNANMQNTSKALINLTTEEHIGGVPFFYYKRTITVSANVIEFTR